MRGNLKKSTKSRKKNKKGAECYHPSGATGAPYMTSTAGGAQSAPPSALRVQATSQQPVQPAPPPDMSKTTMAGHTFVPPQNPTPQSRPLYSVPYRAQHGTRPNTHPRQQQPYIAPGTASTATGPVMYPLYVPAHMVPQSYQQPRSQGYYPYLPSYLNYSTPATHSSPYYFTSNNQQIPNPNLTTNTAGGRSNPTTLMGPQGSTATATAPAATLTHPQGQTHIHQTMTGIRPAQKKCSRRVPIIDPVTQQDILSDLYTNSDSQYLSGDTSERHTPQPEVIHAPEELNRLVNDVVNQAPICESTVNSNFASTKNVDLPISSTSIIQPQPFAMNSINNNTLKSEIVTVNESKNLGPEIVAEPVETPVVSAISDSPVIVPKMPINIKLQKNSDQIVQPVVLDTNKNIPSSKQLKQYKNKPVVPQVDEVVKISDNVSLSPVMAAPATSQVVPAQSPIQTTVPVVMVAPQPQRVRITISRERGKSEDKDKKDKDKNIQQEKENTPPLISMYPDKMNGPSSVVIRSVDSSLEVINPSTSQNNQPASTDLNRQSSNKQSPATDTKTTNISETKGEVINTIDTTCTVQLAPTATELLSASIEKLAKELTSDITKEASSAFQAQAKLTQSLASCVKANHTDHKMKDINLNTKNTDSDAANGNTAEVGKPENVKDVNKNEKAVKNTKNSNKKANKMANSDPNVKEAESYENGKDETDKVSSVEDKMANKDVNIQTASEKVEEKPSTLVSKFKYGEDNWSPNNTSGKKCYEVVLMKQLKESPQSKHKPNAPLLEAWNVSRTSPINDSPPLNLISRPSVSIAPHFLQNSVIGARSNAPRDTKKDGRNMTSGKGSVKLNQTQSGSSSHKPVIHVSLSLREDVKLNETENAWKPTRFKKESVTEEEFKTKELYSKFRGILNKLTPQKFETLMDKVKSLEINNQKRLEGVIDLVFEKAIDEPNFSEAYANMCNKLSMLKVPVDNAATPEHCVNFRGLIINKCQNQFVAAKVDEAVLKLEKELEECTDPTKKKELQLQLEEENRRVRMRSVGNVRFIGELYKRKMLTAKIMVFCMNHLIEKLEEEKLECLCKLLTTIGQQVESDVKEQLENVFKKMQDIVDRKSNKISSRVRFMIQDVIELRRRRWVIKNVVDSQPKMMDQIQKEAEQHQRQIELMNSPMGGFRRDDGGRKRGDGRRQNSNSFMENNWKTNKSSNYIDTNKLKQVTQKNLTNIKLAPHGWNQCSGSKHTVQLPNNSVIGLTKNMYSVLENVQTDPTSLRGNKDTTPTYHSKGASIERSTFDSRGDFMVSGGGSRSGSVGVTRSNSSSRSASAVPTPAPMVVDTPTPPPAPVNQEPLPDDKKKHATAMTQLFLINPDDKEMAAEIKLHFPPQYHAALFTEILNVILEKSPKEVAMVAKSMLYLVSTNTITPSNFLDGFKEIMDFAPELCIDIPMLYDYFGKFFAPQIEKKHITFVQIFKLSQNVISANQGHLLLKAVIRDMKESMGPSFVLSKWQESGLKIAQWMKEDLVPKWIEDNKFEFLEGGAKPGEEIKKILSPSETQSKLLQLMNSDENCECIRGWVQDNLGKSMNEDKFMRALIQGICEHALFGAEGRDVPHFNQERMNKYSGLINEFGETRQAREASCLFGIQQLIHRLEHPQGLTLEIFQYLHEQYIISVEGFIAWEESDMEPEGKGVMMKALTSFFINIKEADNEDSGSED